MKKLTLTILLAYLCIAIQAQTSLLEEDFSTASGSTAPNDWSILTNTGDALVDVWHFDNPGRRDPNAPILAPYAVFDSDKLSDNSLAEEVYLVSPAFDATTTDNILLEFDQYFKEGAGGSCDVEVFDGTNWVNVYTNSSNTTNPQHSQIDIGTEIQNITNAQVRFKWTGDYSWYWIVDNIKVSAVPPAVEQFTEQPGITFPALENTSVAWGDYDNDDDLDILLIGAQSGNIVSKIYRNNGDNTFAEQSGISLTPVTNGSVAWGDYDNDGNLDILLTGSIDAYNNNPVSKIYRNNGDNSFTEQTGIVIAPADYSSVAWGDYDNDGDLDILLTGFGDSEATSKIYRNNGDNSFTEQTDISLPGVYNSSVAWGDYDNDGYPDILLTGYAWLDYISKIYRNNGDNTFTEQTDISLPGVYSGSVAWGDYNNDGYLDILLTGSSSSGYISKIYQNNGDNSFTEQTDISLPGVYYSSVAWGDYDNDGDLDIILTGATDAGSISKIYQNNGDNTFSEDPDISLPGVNEGSVAWGDYDNDKDLDILLSGYDPINESKARIFKNNNSSANTKPSIPNNLSATVINQEIQFSWDKSIDSETPEDGLSYSILVGSSPGAFDIFATMSNIGNGYRKVVQSGNLTGIHPFTLNSSLPAGTYYWGVQSVDNCFEGSAFATSTFDITDAQASYLNFPEILSGSIKIKWTRGNKEKCAVFIKQDSIGSPVLSDNTSYTADTVFTKGSHAGDGWYCVYNGISDSVCISGLYGNNPFRTMVVEYSGEPGNEIYLGASNNTNPQTCYTQDQFTEQTDISLTGVTNGSAAWGDYDNDGDLDILLTGENDSDIGISKIYKNNGNNTFTEQTGISIIGITNGSVAWGDYDNDGDLDILLTGVLDRYDNEPISKIYRNNGDNSFAEQTGIALTGVFNSSVAWCDFNGDGSLDILLTGNTNSGEISKIYRNNGDNSFTEQTNIDLTAVSFGSVAWGDYNNDSYPDILLTGQSWPDNISKIYRNNGDNSFTEQTTISLPAVFNSSVDWGDYDNDGYLDILLTGSTDSEIISKIYHNNGDNSFTEQTGIALTGVEQSSVAWGDYDNDGYLDILLNGSIDYSETRINKIYRNNGDNTFTEQTNFAIAEVNNASSSWGDYDNDGDLDILLTGRDMYYNRISKIYRNNSSKSNTKPLSPENLLATADNQEISFSWDKANDSETPPEGLSYSVFVGSSPGASDIFFPMSDIGNGFRKVIQPGDYIGIQSFTLNSSLPAATYYWGVQSVDNTFEGSAFATSTFTITDAQATYLNFPEVFTGSLKIKWTRGSKEKCAVFIKQDSIGLPVLSDNTSYTADTVFAKGSEAGAGWYCVYNGTNDSVIVTGLNGSSVYKTMVIEYSGEPGNEIYLNASNTTNPQTCSTLEQFTEQRDILLLPVTGRSSAWADYDNDGDLDVLLTGEDNTGSASAVIYRNNGDNTFTEQSGISLHSSYKWFRRLGDYDNDSDLDLLLTGQSSLGRISKIYRNNGDNSFSEQTDISLIGVSSSSVAWVDYDNDGDLDVLLTGSTQSEPVSKIYRNEGNNKFTEQTSIDLTAFTNGSAAWADYDNDGDLDLLLTGESNEHLSKIYRNNGDNSFTEQTSIALVDVNNSSVAWGDYDNDGDLDILLTGDTGSEVISKIYRNNGDNSFIEQTGIALTGIGSGSVGWGDYDNDGYLDIIMSGFVDYSDAKTSKIYRNNRDNSFTEQLVFDLEAAGYGSACWGDYDNDGDLDILLTGRDNNYGRISKIYRNNNSNSNNKPSIPDNLLATVNNQEIQFSWDKADDSETPQDGLSYSLVVGSSPGACDIFSTISDIENGFRKVVQAGNFKGIDSYTFNSSLPAGEYYWGVQSVDNTFEGSAFASSTFTITDAQASYLNFSEILTGSIKINWTRGSKEKCAVFMKQDSIGMPVLSNSTSYLADSVFTGGSQAGAGWYCVYNGIGDSVIVTGLSGSNVFKIMVIEYSGEPGQENYLSASNTTNPQTCYTQDQFTEQTDITLATIEQSSVAWGDYDNDDDLDILLTGRYWNSLISKIYRNDGDNTFTEQSEISLTAITNGSVAWGDYDNDGYLDFVLTGSIHEFENNPVSKIYHNNGDNSFTEQTSIALTAVAYSSVDWGDYDNDGDLDIVVTGMSISEPISKIYRNNGDNSFTEQTNIALTAASHGSVAWGDYNNDGFLDILLTGQAWPDNISKIYRNNGDNTFTEQTDLSLPGVYTGSADWGDYDNDGYLDILLTGQSVTGQISKIYKNNGDNTFSEQTDISLIAVSNSSVDWGDYDNDGFLDILLTGSGQSETISKIYRNNRNNSFTEQTDISLPSVDYQSSVIWGDYDNDKDLDILLTGYDPYDPFHESKTRIFKNNNSSENTKPAMPGNLLAEVDIQEIQFNWDKAIDSETPQAGLSYSLVIGSSPGASDVFSTMSNIENGYRKVVQAGQLKGIDSLTYKSSLPAGIYYWGVQSVDNSYEGSTFANSTFTISDAQAAYLKFSEITTESLKINWTRGNKEKCAVFIKQDNNGIPILSNNTSYIADTIFTHGSEAGAGWYCVYNGIGDSVTVSGLNSSSVYNVMVIEYSGETGQEIYLNAANTTNPQSCNTQEQFTKQTDISLPGVSSGSVAWGDYDNDGNMDFLLTGENDSYTGSSKLYRNNGDDTFTEQSAISIPGILNSSVAWGDYDNDSDLDLLLTGSLDRFDTDLISKIYRNNGNNSFSEQTDISLTGVSHSSVDWGDYDTDGDLDILLSGSTGNNIRVTKIYRNNGDNSFSEQSEITLTGISDGSSSWGDYDNDGDLDILLTGNDGWDGISKIYRNNGDNSFTEQPGIVLANGYNCSSAWGDCDNDGDLDILLIGESTELFSKIYLNNGNNSFTEQTDISLAIVNSGSVAWADYDNDGYLDILLTGSPGQIDTSRISNIYHNNGDNSFREETSFNLSGVNQSAIAWADYDNDGDLDILLTGNNIFYGNISEIYRNNQFRKNTAPSYPSSILAHMESKNLVLSWNMANDNETPQQSLSYNLRIGSSPGASNILSPMSLANGKRCITEPGNAGFNVNWTIDLANYFPIPENLYYSIQAIDNGSLASEWSPEKSEVSSFIADFLPNSSCQKAETQFLDKSFSAEFEITSYQWKFTEGSIITTSNLQNPIYSFQTYGTHLVELSITNSDGASTSTTKSFTVSPSPLVDFTAPAVCQGEPIIFDNTTSANSTIIEDWLWEFGDGSSNSNLEEPGSHPYLNPDDYLVSLKATASNGCSSSIQKTVSVAAIPQAVITTSTPLTFCVGDSVILSTAINPDYLYRWKNNGTTLANAVYDSLTVKQEGSYVVEVTNTIANCVKTSEPSIITTRLAPAPPIITGDENTSFCQGDSLILSVTNSSDINYLWKLNGGAVGSNSNKLSAKSAGSYSLEVSNSFDCSALSINTIDITVKPLPSLPTINIQGENPFCQGDSIILSVTNNSDYTYQWMNKGLNISGENKNTYKALNSGEYSLKVSNTNGCEIITENVSVTTLEMPNAPYITASSPYEFCQGDSLSLSVTNNPDYTYEWKLNEGNIGQGPKLYAKNPGTYKVSVENTIGCSNISSNAIQINVLPLPSISPVSLSSSTEFCENESLTMSVPLNTSYTYQWSNESGPITDENENTFSTNRTGIYSLKISDENGCEINTPNLSITAKAIPLAPAIITENYSQGDCPKDSPITLRVEQPIEEYTYQWKRNGYKIPQANLTYLQDYLSMGDYTVEAINGGCRNESPIQNIFFEDAPEKPLIFAEGPNIWYLACSNDSASTYQWYYNDEAIEGADRHIYVANQNLGSYSVNISNEKGCIISSDIIKIPLDATGIDEHNPLNDILVFPNPTRGMLKIEMNNVLIGELLIRIYTFEGKQIQNSKLNKSTEHVDYQIDLSNQAGGIYLIQFMIDKYVSTRKVIVE